MESDTISLIIIVLYIIMSIYFSAIETTFSPLNRTRVKNMVEKGDERATLVLKLSEDYDGMLSTILIGNNIMGTACASLSTLIFAHFLGDEAGTSISTVITTIVVLIFGEVFPKSIAKGSPEHLAMLPAPLFSIFIKILTLTNFLFRQRKKLLPIVFRSSDKRGITEEELLAIVDEAEQGGGINKQEGTLIRSAIGSMELETGDMFTSRTDIIGIPMDADKEEIAELFAWTGFSRLPVYENSIDRIIGILYQKDFHSYTTRIDRDIREMIKLAMFIARIRKIGQLLKELQRDKVHTAVVLDEFGGTAGIVILEGILEELVGDIWDEHDTVVQGIEKVSDQEYLVLGSTNTDRFFELLQKDQDFSFLTVSGWMMKLAGRIPKEGDSFEYQNLSVTVLRMAERRAEQIRATVKDSQPSLPEE